MKHLMLSKKLLLFGLLLISSSSFSQIIKDEIDLAKSYLQALNEDNFLTIQHRTKIKEEHIPNIYCMLTSEPLKYQEVLDSTIQAKLNKSFLRQNEIINSSHPHQFISLETHAQVDDDCPDLNTFKHEIIVKVKNEAGDIKKFKIYGLSYEDSLYLLDANGSVW